MDRALLKSLNNFQKDAPVYTAPRLPQNSGDVITPQVELFHMAEPSAVYVHELESEDHYQRGLLEGEAKAKAIYQDTIAIMERSLGTLQSQFSSQLKEIQTQHMGLVAAALASIFPDLAMSAFRRDLENLIKDLASDTLVGAVTLRCAPHDHSDVSALLASLTTNSVLSFSVEADERQLRGSIEAAWAGGGTSINYMDAALRTKTSCLELLSQMRRCQIWKQAMSPR